MNARMERIINQFEKNQLCPEEPFKFHCTMCGKCCINREDILLNPRDMYNLAKELNMTPHEVMNTYCETYMASSSLSMVFHAANAWIAALSFTGDM